MPQEPPVSLNIGYNSPAQQYDINKFSYYSGSQITVWFGDILIDDIVSIQWVRSQSKRPIYGYASQQFDAVANGTVMIQGNFSINFRQSGYLSIVLFEIKKIYSEVSNTESWPVIRSIIGQHLKNGTFGPQTSQEIIDIGNSPDFLSLAKGYESIIWGDDTLITGSMSPSDEDESYIKTTPADTRQARDIPDGFNILITYGDTSGNSSRTINDYAQSTTKAINGVHIIGDGQVIQTGGQNIIEQYDFIARGTDEYIGA